MYIRRVCYRNGFYVDINKCGEAVIMKPKPCNEDCQLFRWGKCITKDKVHWLCDQPERYDNALKEWGDEDYPYLRKVKK